MLKKVKRPKMLKKVKHPKMLKKAMHPKILQKAKHLNMLKQPIMPKRLVMLRCPTTLRSIRSTPAIPILSLSQAPIILRYNIRVYRLKRYPNS